MSEDKTISQVTYKQILTLLDQLIETSIWQDAKLKSKDPIKNPGESFVTNKLKLIRKTLKNEN
ncbi:MAG TPA: hypothetical protein EYN67_10320 [Flavobacteriales bacterium]|nr:hypothetical protein [Flavobacteriales bacterium]